MKKIPHTSDNVKEYREKFNVSLQEASNYIKKHNLLVELNDAVTINDFKVPLVQLLKLII